MTRLEINLIADIKEHSAIKYFGLFDVAKKIGEEVVELGEALGENRSGNNKASIIEEASDIAILAWDILIKCGKKPMEAMAIKMDILEGRFPYRGKSAKQVNRI